MEEHTKKTILVVEDEELLLQAICKKLELNGFDYISCVTGKQALDYLESLSSVPDAIWLDYYLKDMNGLEFMMELKKQEKFANIPVVVVSNSASPDKVHHMLALGVSKYLLKAEYQLSEIIDIITKFVSE